MKHTRIVRAFAAHCLLLCACVAAGAAQPAEEQNPRRPTLLEPASRNTSYLADLRLWRGELDRFQDDRNCLKTARMFTI